MKWNSKKIAELAKKDFEKAWLDTENLVRVKGKKKPLEFKKPGISHVVFDTLQRLRDAYLDLGFEEVTNPILIEDVEVKKQFGPEATAVLDRCYYVGGLPRPDIGLSDEKIARIRSYGGKIDKEKVQEVLHGYKKGEFGGDDLIYKLADALDVDDSLATKILDELFPEFKVLEPVSTRVTLRSHMTSGWFLTLGRLLGKRSMPIKLFSVDRCFRREQKEDESHLRVYHSASCVVADKDVSIEDGKEVATLILKKFGFEKFKFKLDEKRSKYYAPGTQMEVYGYNEKTKWVEIATFGIYSPVALSRYKIEVPVMNLGLGVERLTMVLHGYKDARAMVLPQFHEKWELSDRQIAEMLHVCKKPATYEGNNVVNLIIEIAKSHAKEESPCSFPVYYGKVSDSEVEVDLVEVEENTKLLGPAAFNGVYVNAGNIYGIDERGLRGIGKTALNSGMRYIDAIANFAAYEIEKGVLAGRKEIVTKIKMVKSLGDINLKLDDSALRYITANNKKIDVRGPVFMTIKTKVKRKSA